MYELLVLISSMLTTGMRRGATAVRDQSKSRRGVCAFHPSSYRPSQMLYQHAQTAVAVQEVEGQGGRGPRAKKEIGRRKYVCIRMHGCSTKHVHCVRAPYAAYVGTWLYVQLFVSHLLGGGSTSSDRERRHSQPAAHVGQRHERAHYMAGDLSGCDKTEGECCAGEAA
jgi:hypothetical protein